MTTRQRSLTEQNKTLVRRFVEEHDRRKTLPDEMCAPSYTLHFQRSPPMDLKGTKGLVEMMYAAFPDARHTLDDLIAEGDKVVMRITIRGTHKGDLMGITPTGKQVTMSGIDILRIAGGKVAEDWFVMDQLGLMQQIGAVP